MGVYIPPPGDDESRGKGSKGSSASNSTNGATEATYTTGGTSVPPSSSASSSLIQAWIPRNPSVGLVWGPLVPASDNRTALYFMTGLQLIGSMYLFRKARHIWKPPMQVYGQPQGSIAKALIPFTLGAVGTFGAGLELTRMSLPYDPWLEEAKYYRKLATKNGDRPSTWFGAYSYYRPMDMNTWTDKVSNWIQRVDNEITVDENGKPISLSIPSRTSLLAKLNNKGKYSEIYQRLVESNRSRQQALLENELKDVTDLNKAERIDLILEGKSPYVNPYFTKPHIQLGNHSMESDSDFEMVWLNFDPWDELKFDTDYDIRLIPRWRLNEDEEVKQRMQEINGLSNQE